MSQADLAARDARHDLCPLTAFDLQVTTCLGA
jgi:hypothetical protein